MSDIINFTEGKDKEKRLAYGHLWEEHDPSKRSRAARKALLEVMTMEDQKHGIERARDENINRRD